MVDTTIRIGLEVDGSQAIKEFENVTAASDAVLTNIKKIPQCGVHTAGFYCTPSGVAKVNRSRSGGWPGS